MGTTASTFKCRDTPSNFTNRLPITDENDNVIEIAQQFANRCLPRFVIRSIKRYLAVGRFTYNSDTLATAANAEFLRDPLFQQAYAAGKATDSWRHDIQWRVFTACWAAWHAKSLEGDFVECGVNRGGISRAVMHYIDFKNLSKTFYLLDTFNGLVAEQITADERKHGITRIHYDECYDTVSHTFAGFDNVQIIRGAIPGTLSQVKTNKVCYLHIDMNCAAPEIAAAEYFWDKLVPGAVMLLDDYGWMNHRVQKRRFDEFARRRGVRVLLLPTGQGILLKPQQSARADGMPVLLQQHSDARSTPSETSDA